MPEQVIAGFNSYNQMMKNIAQSQNIPLADIRGAINSDSSNWGDATHFNYSGSNLAAKEFFLTISPLLKNKK